MMARTPKHSLEEYERALMDAGFYTGLQRLALDYAIAGLQHIYAVSDDEDILDTVASAMHEMNQIMQRKPPWHKYSIDEDVQCG